MTVEKEYTSSFVLDKGKLSRIINIIEERFSSINTKNEMQFHITLQNDKNIKVKNLEEVYKLDNTVKNPIIFLKLSVVVEPQKDEPECFLGFNKWKTDNVYLRISSSDAKWANQFFAEIEEQIERTMQNSWIFKLKYQFSDILWNAILAGVVVAVTTGMITALLLKPSEKKYQANKEFLTTAQIESLSVHSKQINDIDEKIDFLFEIHKQQIENLNKVNVSKDNRWSQLKSSIQGVLNLRTLFMILPFLIILGCMVYLFRFCYPHAVFNWGDYGEHYTKILSKRKNLWTVVVIAILVGIVANMFVLSISEFINSS